MRRDELLTRLGRYPTVSLMERPTPLHHLNQLGAALGVDLWLKRDDLTSLGLGGDKPRKLEYELARAIEAGADVLVTCGSAQSNHARLTTAAARHLGLDVTVVLSGDERAVIQGNLLTVHMMGADVVLAETDDHWDLEADVTAVCERLRESGRTPYFVPISGTTPHSCLGYVDGALELLLQLEDVGVVPDVIVLPFGTGGIFTAYLMTLRALGVPSHLTGISVNRSEAECTTNLDHWWRPLAELLELASGITPDGYDIDDDYVGREYGDATPACLDAIVHMASVEGILLDPVYSGKVFAGLEGRVHEGSIPQGSTVVMLHSGGVPANFAYHAELEAYMRSSRAAASPP
jgi:1-aminocyclopropane-1-carboxylate deaminase/D-cysteine desulfhydrase-like pyridoxal-dependent ACC family enzyme